MLSRIQCLGSCLIVLTLLLFAGSAAAQDVSPRCEAAIDRAAGTTASACSQPTPPLRGMEPDQTGKPPGAL